MSRVVTHVTQSFVPLSEAWLYDVVTAPVSREARVLARRRENEEDFPFDRVELLEARARRGSPLWLRHQLHSRLGWPQTPANLWRGSLRAHAGAADVVHAHYGPVGWRCIDAGLAPVVTSFYGFDATETETLALWRSAYRTLFRDGAAFVVEGPAMRDRLLALGAPGERTHVVPLPVRLDSEWRPATLADEETPRILMAGRFVPKKGFADGIAAFAQMQGARLTIVGAGPDEEILRRAAATVGDVELLPPQPLARLRELIRSCHVFLQPSLTAPDGDAEGGAPVTLLEAQALGRVIVASDHADIPNVVDPAAAFLFPEGDVGALAANLSRALALPEEWEARGAAGRRFVEEHHSREGAAVLLDRIYDGLDA